MRIQSIAMACALLAGCATGGQGMMTDGSVPSVAGSGRPMLADPYTSPEIPEIYETPPDVTPARQ